MTWVAEHADVEKACDEDEEAEDDDLHDQSDDDDCLAEVVV